MRWNIKFETSFERSVMSKAKSTITSEADTTTVCVKRNYAAGVEPTTAQRVWEIVSDFGGIRTIFPSLVRNLLTYPDATGTVIGMVRDMTFIIPNSSNPLSTSIEQLIQLDPESHRLTYIAVLGLPVTNYQSAMEVTGDEACTLTWTSTFKPNQDESGKAFAKILAGILTGGADQIATVLSLD